MKVVYVEPKAERTLWVWANDIAPGQVFSGVLNFNDGYHELATIYPYQRDRDAARKSVFLRFPGGFMDLTDPQFVVLFKAGLELKAAVSVHNYQALDATINVSVRGLEEAVLTKSLTDAVAQARPCWETSPEHTPTAKWLGENPLDIRRPENV